MVLLGVLVGAEMVYMVGSYLREAGLPVAMTTREPLVSHEALLLPPPPFLLDQSQKLVPSQSQQG